MFGKSLDLPEAIIEIWIKKPDNMGRIFLLILCLGLTFVLQAQVTRTLNVTAGSLSIALTSTELSTVTNLTLTGTIDARDFKTMRDNMPLLASIDLSGASIAAYSGTEGTYYTNMNYPANTIPYSAFYNFSSNPRVGKITLTIFICPSTATSIGDSSFSGCSSLSSIIIPSSVKAIGTYAFQYCSGLTSITIPSSVNSIGTSAFTGCSNFKSIYTYNHIPVNLSFSNVFDTIDKTNCILYVPNGTSGLYAAAYLWKDFSNIVEMPTFKLSAINAMVSCTGGSTASIDISTGLSWTILSDQSWLTISSTSGTGNATLNFSAGANTSLSQRVAKVTVSPTDVPAQTIIITQSGTPKAVNLNAGGLSAALTAQEKNTITNLTLTGTIDARDFKTMRDSIPMLAIVDLSGTTVKAYTGTGGTDGTYNATYPENTIPKYAFSYNNITTRGKRLTFFGFPSNITSIDSDAFTNCYDLTSIAFPSTVITIGYSAFAYCTGLISVTIPSSVNSIYRSAFQGASGSITVNADNPNYSSLDGVLFDKAKTNLIFCPTSKSGSYTIPSSVISIGESAFVNCSGLTSVTIPSSVTSIGSGAFSLCGGLISVSIPSSVSSIEDYTFSHCNSLTSITFPASIKTIGANALAYCSGLNSIYTFNPKPIKFVADNGVFNDIDKSKCTLYVPNGSSGLYKAANQWKDFAKIFEMNEFALSVTNLKVSAAGGNMEGVDIKTGLSWSALSDQTWLAVSTSSGTGNVKLAFTAEVNTSFAQRIATVTVSAPGVPVQSIVVIQAGTPKTVDITAGGLASAFTAGELAFVSHLTVTGTIDARDFKTMRDNMPLLVDLDLSGTTIAAYTGTEGTSGTNSVTYPANQVPNNALFNNISVGKKSLISFILPLSATSTGGYAFGDCSSLTSVLIPSSLTSIGNYAFSGCSNLTSIVIPSKVTTINTGTFASCSNLSLVTIPNSVTTIGASAFSNCSSLTSIALPLTVTSIGGSAFAGCSSLISVSIPSSVTSIGNNAFEACSSLISLTIPSSVTSIGQFAFRFCYGLKSVTIPSSVTAIGLQTFASCTGLTSIIIPSSVVSIGSSAFENCSGLTSFYACNNVPVNLSSSNYVFSSVNKTTCKLYVPQGSKALYAAAYQWKDFTNIQEMPEFNLSATTARISATAGSSATIDITTGTSWLVSSDQAWLTISSSSGSGNATLTFTAGSNTSVTGRVAMVTFYATGSFPRTFIVSQTGIPLNITAGGLSTALTLEDLNTITDLSLTGTIDARDFKTMRDNMPLLAVIDLSSATIVAYTGTEGTQGTSSIEYPANTVPNSAFYSSTGKGKTTLISVILPPSISSIGSNGFSSCTGLITVNIPSSVTSIGSNAFMGSSGFITVETNNANYSSSDGLLFDKAKTVLIQCPVSKTGTYTIPSSVSIIGIYAFSKCTFLTTVNIPSSVTTINPLAFDNCTGLTTLAIPSSVTSVGNAAFQNCIKLTTLIIPSSLTVISGFVFNNCSSLSSLTIPTSVTAIDQNAFSGCRSLTSLTIPASLKTIGGSAFAYCNGLTSINANAINPIDLNSSLGVFNGVNKTTCTLYVPYKTRERYVAANQWKDFTNISEEKEGILPDPITKSFPVAGGTSNINITSNVCWTATTDQTWLTISPYNCTVNTLGFTVSTNSSNVFRTAIITLSAKSATTRTITVSQEGIPKTIAITAGGLATALTSEELKGVTNLTITGTMDARDFKTMRDDMPLLASLDLGNATIVAYTGTEGTKGSSITEYPANTIPKYAFFNSGLGMGTGKISLVSFTLPKSITSIDDYAFCYCSGLTSISIPSKVTTIGISAFNSCSRLSSFTIPASVTSIGVSAFLYCSGLTSIYANSVLPVDLSASTNVFYGVNKTNCILYVPYQTGVLYRAASQWKDFLSILDANQGFNLSSNVVNLASAEGSTATVELTANVAWTGGTDQNWLTVSPGLGTGTQTLTFTAKVNTSATSRNAIVTVSSPDIDSQTITVTQEAQSQTVKAMRIIAEDVSNCYRQDNNYAVPIRMCDFVNIDSLVLVLKYEKSVFGYTGYKELNSLLATSGKFVIVQSSVDSKWNKLTITWDSNDVPKTLEPSNDSIIVFTLNFNLNNFPTYRYNTNDTLVKVSELKWNNVESKYWNLNGEVINILPFITSDGSLTVNQSINDIELDIKIADTESGVANATVTSPVGDYSYFWNGSTSPSNGTASVQVPSTNTVVAKRGACMSYVKQFVIDLPITEMAIHLLTQGSLSALLTTMQKNNLVKLTLTGNIDARDFKTMRDNMPELVVVDLSGATIVAYTGADGTDLGVSNASYPANTLPNNAFRKKELNAIVLPSTLNTIGDFALADCRSLTSTIISNLVTSIGSFAFNSCESLSSIYSFRNAPVQLHEPPSVFVGINKTTCKLYVPFGSASLYSISTEWKEFSNIIEMPGFSLSTDSASISPAQGSTASVELNSNTSWSIISNQSWLTVNSISGTGNQILTFTAQANPTSSARKATITVSATGLVPKTITITQESGIPTTLTINNTAGGLYSLITTNDLSKITNLTITGTMDARDFKAIRDYMPNLAALDLSGVTFANYTGTEGTAGTTNLNYPANTIPENAFLNMKNLVTVILPKTVNALGKSSFEGCISLTTITLPSSVNSIGENAFRYCSLTSIIFHSSEITVGDSAFYQCLDLSKIFSFGTNPLILNGNTSPFAGLNSGIVLYVPSGASGLYQNSDLWKSFANLSEIPGFILSSKTAKIAAKEGSTFSLPISSYTNWTASSDQDWLTIDPKTGTGNQTLTFTAKTNPSTTVRTAIVTVSASGVESQTVTIIQEAKNESLPQHFIPVWTGNGNDHMNINIYSAKVDGVDLEIGDEIGIFDGNACVGAGIVTVPIYQSNTMDLVVSKKDDYFDGYTSGNPISFKVYQKNIGREVTTLQTHYLNLDPSWSSDGVFAPGMTAFAELTETSTVIQEIILISGWNIISANVVPSNLNLKDLFQKLIDAGKLKKVMDETGKSLENFGILGGWKNNIGDLLQTKGYKVNVNSPCTLSLEGEPVSLPISINLMKGWNIISYPSASSQDAKALVQSLIDLGKLKKVMDETGKTIENFGVLGGWKNNIGNFLSGKGYKVNVLENCALTIPATATKAATIVPEVLASTHFTKAFKGNGTDHMNIHLVNLHSSGLQAGDEIGIYDGKLCVGSQTIGAEDMLSGVISIPASACDESGTKIDGFTPGHPVALKLFRNNREYTLKTVTLQNSRGNFAKGESMFAQVNIGHTTGIAEYGNQTFVKCYPNPFNDQLTIEIQLQEVGKLDVTIYDSGGKLVRKLYKGPVEKVEKLVWDGRDERGVRMVPGTYMLKVNDWVEKVVLKE